MSPPTPERFVVQCECGRMLTLRKNETVTCPACACEHDYHNLLPRLEEPPPTDHERREGDADGE
jgi:hypothetical protein